MLTLFHAPKSRSSRVIWLLEELGAKYEIKYTNIARMDGSGGSDAENPHPYKKVPAIVHDGALVTESAAVFAYLTDLFPEAGLAPRVGDAKRGPYLSWLAYYAGVIEPVVTLEHAKLLENPMIERTFRGREELDETISTALDKGKFLMGDAFGAVDVLIGSMGQWFRSALPPGERVDAYLKDCAARPALARAFAKDAPSS